ncbi:MAG: hypothetical protein ACM3SU_10685 [Acidobacteriota bacterium]
MSQDANPERQLLRHTLATLAYRGGKAVGGVSPEVAAFRAGATSRTPAEILSHVGDLLDWAVHLCRGEHVWKDSAPLPWEKEVARFFAGLERLDGHLASPAPLGFAAEKIFQGPIADALAHVGQIALLRRLAGSPVRGENYFKAEITAGRVGPQQPAPRFEFD